VYLAPRGGLANLARVATAMATPRAATYGRRLSVAQYNAQYAPTAAAVRRVSGFLRGAGLRVTALAAGHHYLAFRGTVASADTAFGTRLVRYRRAGRVVRAPAAAVSVPAGLASTVLTVTGLDTSPSVTRPTVVAPSGQPDGFRNATPCSAHFGQVKAQYESDGVTPLPQFNGQTLTYAPCGYTGKQLRSAYENNSTLDGSGVTVAIVDAYASPTIAADAQKYAKRNGDGAYLPGQLTETTADTYTHKPACGGAGGWHGEESLDVEAVHAMAPGANIHYYGGASCEEDDLLDALTQVDTDDTAQLVSNSWTEPTGDFPAGLFQAYESVFLQGALEGISFIFGSGDDGDEVADSGIKQVDYPASDPYVTAVGGTSAAIGAAGNMKFETGWGDQKYPLSADGTSWAAPTFYGGAGGGTSSVFAQPSYQAGTTPGPYRAVPDVAMDADSTTGFLIGETQKFPDGTYYDQYRIGGTSLSTPLFAGMTALSLEHAGTGIGLLNPTIYADQAAFTDIKGSPNQAGDVRVDFVNGTDASDGLIYSVRTFQDDTSLNVKKGWDPVTGLGSVNSNWLTAISP
jgi:subtilase family serine protease